MRELYDETESLLTPAQRSDVQINSDHQHRQELKSLPEEVQVNESSNGGYSDDEEF